MLTLTHNPSSDRGHFCFFSPWCCIFLGAQMGKGVCSGGGGDVLIIAVYGTLMGWR